MTSHRKEELLKQLDSALNRKVQEKYYNMAKTHNRQQERGPKQSNLEVKGYRSKDNFNKSPTTIKQTEMLKMQRSSEQFSPTFSASNIVPEKGVSPRFQKPTQESGQASIFVVKLKEENSMLQKENYRLTKQLISFKSTISSLEQQTKNLKRDQQEYLRMKETADSLVRQIQFLKNKDKKESKKAKVFSLTESLGFQESIKEIMMQLNLSFINKQWNESFIIDSMQSISKQIYKLVEEKSKLSAKLNKFDIESVLAKENNVAFKQEISKLQAQVENYQSELSACNTTIRQLQQEFDVMLKEKKQIQSRYKEVMRDVESSKKEIKMMMESSKHRKPKRQSSILKKERESTLIQSTVARNFIDFEIQTETLQTEIGIQSENNQIEQAHHNEKKNEIIEGLQKQLANLQSKIIDFKKKELFWTQQSLETESERKELEKKVMNLQELKLALKEEISKCQEQIKGDEEYIRQLQLKSQEINRDISIFMPQLKSIEEQNGELKAKNVKKDQDLIAKHQLISQLTSQNDELRENLCMKDKKIQQLSFQTEKRKQDIDRLSSQIVDLNGRNNQLETSMLQKDSFIRNSIQNQIQKLQKEKSQQQHLMHSKLTSKEKELEQLRKELQKSEDLLKKETSETEQVNHRLLLLKSQFSEKEETFRREKEKMKDAIQQIMILNKELTKKQTQYETQYNTMENKMISFQSQNNQVTQSYIQLESSLSNLSQELKNTKEENQQLKNKNENTQNEFERLTLLKKELEVQRNGWLFLQKQLESINNELKSKIKVYEEHSSSIEKQNKECKHTIIVLEDKIKDLSGHSSQMKQSSLLQDNELKRLHQVIDQLQIKNQHLTQGYDQLKVESEAALKAKTQELSNQSYDIQRLVRDNRNLQNQLDQLTSLSLSKQFSEGQINKKLQSLMEENQTLNTRNQYLAEQLQMKRRNKEEDQYIAELKTKQYCLMVKKILTNVIELGELEECMNLEMLLEVGSQKIVEQKRKAFDQQLREGNQQYEPNDEPRKRFNFGVEISSYQDLVLLSSRHKEGEMKSEGLQGSQVNQPLSSPRSIIFKLNANSPQVQRRTDRLVSQYPGNVKEDQQQS